MLDALTFFGFFAVVPAVESADEIASDAAETFELFPEVLLVGCVVIFSGGFVAVFGDEVDAELDEAADMEGVVRLNGCESFGDGVVGDVGILAQGLFEPVGVEFLSIRRLKINDVFHKSLLLDFGYLSELILLMIIYAIYSVCQYQKYTKCSVPNLSTSAVFASLFWVGEHLRCVFFAEFVEASADVDDVVLDFATEFFVHLFVDEFATESLNGFGAGEVAFFATE